ncbi:hypothetical protein TUM19329_18500 [Legionella antarctica]|uniref:Coiled-coil-containing protein n=1 Tax=Legionella antarctica TaxID=2708020 RepID=A0A6F8T4W4_9GAMM|nr:hypothetical protein [Legionella antarctica]BCA95489.1 hypothetical protein TUM19329_18500 [Legionella antarctica]
MSKAKRESKKKVVDAFHSKLNQYQVLRTELARNSYNPPQEKAKELQDALENLGRLSEELEKMDRSPAQTKALQEARATDVDNIKQLRRILPSLISSHNKQAEKMREYAEQEQQKVREAESVIPELFRQIEAATEDYLKATSRTIDERLQIFKDLTKELQNFLRKLPKGEERTGYFKDLTSFATKINVKHEENEQLLREMREQHQEQVKDNRKKINQVVEKGGSLVDVLFLTASKEVKKAVAQLIENKDVMALLDNERLLEILGTESVAEGLKQITSGDSHGAVATISQQNQLAALETILGVLSRNEDISSKDVALARQFLGTVVSMVKVTQELQRGEKQYATFVAEVDGSVKVMHVSLDDILTDSSTLVRILSTFKEQGVASQPLQMVLTSREQAAAISIVMNNVDPGALTGRIGSLSQKELRSLTQGTMSSALVKASTGELVVKSLADVTNLIAQSASHVGTLVRVLGTAYLDLEQQISQVMNGMAAQYANKPATIFTAEQTFHLVNEFVALSLSAQTIQRGAIGSFVNSSLFPINSGSSVTLVDSSLANNSVGQNLLVGMVPEEPHQLAIGQADPVLIVPPQLESDAIELGPFLGAGDFEEESPPAQKKLESEEPFLGARDFENKSPPPQKKKKPVDLSEHELKFVMLLSELEALGTELANKQQLVGEKYNEVVNSAGILLSTLEAEGSLFFAQKNPTVKQLDDFKTKCTDAIETAEKEFKQHRGVWWDSSGFLGKLLAVTKAILGVVAGVTVIPAVLVESTTKHGYINTFFTKPETDSAKKLAEAKSKFKQQTEGIDIDNDSENEANGEPKSNI